jgi:hypothetical protein
MALQYKQPKKGGKHPKKVGKTPKKREENTSFFRGFSPFYSKLIYHFSIMNILMPVKPVLINLMRNSMLKRLTGNGFTKQANYSYYNKTGYKKHLLLLKKLCGNRSIYFLLKTLPCGYRIIYILSKTIPCGGRITYILPKTIPCGGRSIYILPKTIPCGGRITYISPKTIPCGGRSIYVL